MNLYFKLALMFVVNLFPGKRCRPYGWHQGPKHLHASSSQTEEIAGFYTLFLIFLIFKVVSLRQRKRWKRWVCRPESKDTSKQMNKFIISDIIEGNTMRGWHWKIYNLQAWDNQLATQQFFHLMVKGCKSQ